MDGRTPNNDFARSYSHAHYLPTSSIAYLPLSCDEELVEEADEPPDSFMHLFSQSYHSPSLSEGEFSKHSIRNSAPTESLLTKALTSPDLRPIANMDDATPKTRLQRGMSTSSNWSSASAASTVDLTSDGLTSPSRANTPSPTPPMSFADIPSILQRTKIAFAGPQLNTDFAKEAAPVRKPGITFACMGQQAPAAEPPQTRPPVQQGENAPPKKKAGLTFACNQPAKSVPVSPVKLHSEPVMIVGSEAKYARDPRRLYDSEDIEDSWTNQPIDHSRLLRVDDVLKKERDIRKLSEEAEREAKQENGEDDDDDEDEENDGEDTVCVDDDDDDEDQDDNDDDDDDDDDDDEDDDDEDEDDDEDDDDDYDGMSGNETDTEEGFADDDSDDDLLFFGPHPPYALSKPHKPLCCRTTSDTSLDTPHPSRRHARPPTPELPDSTDFVCGTLDEDRALEEAYVSCIESRRQKSKGALTPQDIDPSFPISDPESDDDSLPVRTTRALLSRSQSSVERRTRHRSPNPGLPRRGTVRHSPPPPRRNHSPAPSRRLRSPPPRRPSPAPPRRLHSPPPPRSNKSSRHPSPAPRGRAPSPAPQRTIQFNTMRPLVRTRSLPRTSACVRRTAKAARTLTSTSPQKRATRPVQIKRGAADIFSGLEKRRERRKAARLGTGKKDCKAGEGAEKMRELALELGGRGRKKVQCIISA